MTTELEQAEADLLRATAHMTDFILSRRCPHERLRETLRAAVAFGRVGAAFSTRDVDRLAASFGNAEDWQVGPEPDDTALVA